MLVPLCRGDRKEIYAVRVRDTPDDRWSLARETMIEHCALNHAVECQVLLGMGMDELRNMEAGLIRIGRTASTED